MERPRLMNTMLSAAIGVMVAGALLVVSTTDVRAAFITGNMSIVGGVIPNTANIQDATILDFTPAGGGTGIFRAASCDGDFASSLFCDPIFGDLGTITDLTIDPFVPPAVGFWTIGAFTFDLLNISSIDRTTSNVLSVLGTGTIRSGGFDDTSGTWLLTANQLGSTFSYSASTGSTAIPEPRSLALFGIGLLGLGYILRRRSRTGPAN